MFDETLRRIVETTDGAVGALIMGLDGICVARAEAGSEIDIDVVAAEYTTLLRKSMKNAEDAALGELRELVVTADRLAFLIKPITSEYFLLLVLGAHRGLGRARFELRKAQLLLEEEFSL
jgi:predicted regulator of Ras-like GTPase activity (Roadblock/LC7/MglB family)